MSWRNALLTGGALLLLITVIVCCTRENDPVYRGKRLSKHLEAYSANGLNAGGAINNWGESTRIVLPGINPRCSAPLAQEAVLQVGPKALPMLVRMLSTQDSRLRRWVWSTVESHAFLRRFIHNKPPTTGFAGQIRALAAFQELGPRAAPAIPKIIPLLDDPDFAEFAIAALISIKPVRKSDILALTNVFRIKTVNIFGGPADLTHGSAILALSAFGSSAAPAIPFLFDCMHSTNGRIRSCAGYALVQIGAPVEKVLPLLVAEIPKTNPPPPIRTFPPTAASFASQAKFFEDCQNLEMVLYALSELGNKATSALPVISNLQSYPLGNIQSAAAETAAKIRTGY